MRRIGKRLAVTGMLAILFLVIGVPVDANAGPVGIGDSGGKNKKCCNCSYTLRKPPIFYGGPRDCQLTDSSGSCGECTHDAMAGEGGPIEFDYEDSGNGGYEIDIDVGTGLECSDDSFCQQICDANKPDKEDIKDMCEDAKECLELFPWPVPTIEIKDAFTPSQGHSQSEIPEDSITPEYGGVESGGSVS